MGGPAAREEERDGGRPRPRTGGTRSAERSGFPSARRSRTEDGKIWAGCNVENSTYGLTVCAERVAIWKALSEGVRSFRAVAVVTGADEPTPPCGACRQILWEFAGDVPIVMATAAGKTKHFQWRELFPEPSTSERKP